MRIVLLDSGRHCRGGQRQVHFLAQGLAARGHEVHLGAPPDGWLAGARGAGVAFTPLTPRSDWDVRAALALGIAAHRRRATLIHAQDARSHAVARWAQLLGWRGPLIVTRRVTRRPRGALKYRRGVARYIAISRPVRDALLAAGVPAARIDLVPSGVAWPEQAGVAAEAGEAAERARLRVEAGEALIVTLSALTAEKGVEVMVDAAALARRYGLRARWIVCGDGPLRAELEARARTMGAPIHFAGFRQDLAPVLRAADLCVHTPWAEALGTGVLEALARGVPIVATAVGGLRELVPRAGGVLVPPGNPDAVARAVRCVLADQTARRTARRLGPRVARRFSVERMVAGTVRAYRRALRDAKGGS